MAKKLTEGIHRGLYENLAFGRELDGETARKYKKFKLCEKFNWTPQEYDSIPVSVITEFLAIMNTEAKAREVKK